MKFIIEETLFNEVLALMDDAPFGKVMRIIKTVTSNPYIEQDVAESSEPVAVEDATLKVVDSENKKK